MTLFSRLDGGKNPNLNANRKEDLEGTVVCVCCAAMQSPCNLDFS